MGVFRQPLFEDVTGVILAGGKSRRFGKNKAWEALDGTPLIERAIEAMGHVFRDIILLTNTPHEYAHLNLTMFQDLVKGLGPIGGITTALSVISNEAGFFVACDMPFLNGNLIRYMVENRQGVDVVVPRISGKMEALHALYSKGCLTALKNQIASGKYQIIQIFSEVSVRYIEENEIRRFDPTFRSFLNINTSRELRRLKNP